MSQRTTNALRRTPAPYEAVVTATLPSVLYRAMGLLSGFLKPLRFRTHSGSGAVWLSGDQVLELREQFQRTAFRSSTLGHPTQGVPKDLAPAAKPSSHISQRVPRGAGFSQLRSTS